MARMPHMSYRSALAHCLDALVHWAKMHDTEAMGTTYMLMEDVNRYRHRLGLFDVDLRDEWGKTVDEVAQADLVEAEKLMHSVLTAVHDYQVRTNRVFTGAIYLAPHDWDRIVAATKIITNPEACDPDDPANYRYNDPASTAREGTLFGCRAESSADLPEGVFLLGELHKVHP